MALTKELIPTLNKRKLSLLHMDKEPYILIAYLYFTKILPDNYRDLLSWKCQSILGKYIKWHIYYIYWLRPPSIGFILRGKLKAQFSKKNKTF